jgi:hypothetical protein
MSTRTQLTGPEWNALGSDDKRRLARSAGFSESESALLSKLYWEGFPVFVIRQLEIGKEKMNEDTRDTA